MNRFIKILNWLFLPVLLGVLLLLGGVTLTGLLAVYFTEQRFFGLPVQMMQSIEDLLAWAPISLFLGGIAGYFSTTRPVFAGATIAVVGIIFFAITLSVSGLFLDDKFRFDLNGFFSIFIFLLRTSGPMMLIFSPLGACLGARLKQRFKQS